jgi:cytoskeletal protein CcmA (bactofilin family)
MAVGRSDTRAARETVVDCARRGNPGVFAGFASVAELPPYDDDAAWDGKTIDGDWLADFLTDPGAVFHRRGVSIVGARILGGLDLECAELEHRVNLVSCQLGTDGLRIAVSGSLLFRGLDSAGPVHLVGAHIDGTLSCLGATVRSPGGVALDADRAHVGGFVVFAGLTAAGEVRLSGATLGGRLDCTGARFDNPSGTALQIGGASISGPLQLTQVVADGEIGMVNTTVGGDLGCGGASLTAPDGVALWASRARIAGNVFLERDFKAVGQIRLSGATIGGNLRAAGAQVTRSNAAALDFDGIRVEGNLRFTDDFATEGRIRLVGATIGGNLDCTGARFQAVAGDEGPVLDATDAQVTASLSLRRATATGEVVLTGVTVGGDLFCTGADMRRPSATAFVGDRARVGGGLFLDGGFAARGEVRLLGVRVGGDLEATGASLECGGGTALDAGGAQVGGSVRLDHGFTAHGRVRVPAMTIGNDLSCSDGRFDNPDAQALVVSGSRIAGTLVLHRGFRADGLVTLRGTTAGTLRDDRESWPQLMDIDGFHYEKLICPAPDRRWRARREWLRRQREPNAEGYARLAAVYRSAGEESDARRTLMERHNALLRPPRHWREHVPSGWRRVVGRAWRRVLRYTIGHGYSPARSLLIAVPLVAALAVWLGHARAEDMLIATDETPATAAASADGDDVRSSDCESAYPCVQPVVYALDNVVPIVDLGQRSRWAPDQSRHGAEWWDSGRWLAAALWAASALGWILATLVAASFTGVVRRE